MTALTVRLTASSSRSSLCARASLAKCLARGLHTRKALPYPIEGGLGKFLPPQALQTVAVDYQEGLLERLNDEVRGTPYENKSVTQTVIDTAPYRNTTLAFNYSSLALNNSFYLSNLRPAPENFNNHEHLIDHNLLANIRQNYGSLEELKSQFSAATLGLSASGWVWLVSDMRGNLSILPTHGAGTLLIRSKQYMVSDGHLSVNLDMLPTEEHVGSGSAEDLYPSPYATNPTQRETPPGVGTSSPTSSMSMPSDPLPKNPNTSQRFSFHTSAQSQLASSPTLNMLASARAGADMSILSGSAASLGDRSSAPGYRAPNKVAQLNTGTPVYPLFCVSVHEHNWLSAGYGVWGKEEWIKEFWNVLSWPTVNKTWQTLYGESRLPIM